MGYSVIFKALEVQPKSFKGLKKFKTRCIFEAQNLRGDAMVNFKLTMSNKKYIRFLENGVRVEELLFEVKLGPNFEYIHCDIELEVIALPVRPAALVQFKLKALKKDAADNTLGSNFMVTVKR